jgi:hypothetical protein
MLRFEADELMELTVRFATTISSSGLPIGFVLLIWFDWKCPLYDAYLLVSGIHGALLLVIAGALLLVVAAVGEIVKGDRLSTRISNSGMNLTLLFTAVYPSFPCSNLEIG